MVKILFYLSDGVYSAKYKLFGKDNIPNIGRKIFHQNLSIGIMQSFLTKFVSYLVRFSSHMINLSFL